MLEALADLLRAFGSVAVPLLDDGGQPECLAEVWLLLTWILSLHRRLAGTGRHGRWIGPGVPGDLARIQWQALGDTLSRMGRAPAALDPGQSLRLDPPFPYEVEV
jgi:hypothetical protein